MLWVSGGGVEQPIEEANHDKYQNRDPQRPVDQDRPMIFRQGRDNADTDEQQRRDQTAIV
jgi:hypothetical protein